MKYPNCTWQPFLSLGITHYGLSFGTCYWLLPYSNTTNALLKASRPGYDSRVYTVDSKERTSTKVIREHFAVNKSMPLTSNFVEDWRNGERLRSGRYLLERRADLQVSPQRTKPF